MIEWDHLYGRGTRKGPRLDLIEPPGANQKPNRATDKCHEDKDSLMSSLGGEKLGSKYPLRHQP